jgi:predicted amidophosphoribosyltransferase
MYLKVVCAWCGRFMHLKEVPECDQPQLPISHSICPACKENLERAIQKPLPTDKTIDSHERRQNHE